MAVASKQMLEIVIGSGQTDHIITMKESRPVAARDLEKVCDRRLQIAGSTLPALHRSQEANHSAAHLAGTEPIWIVQDTSRGMNPGIGSLHRFP